MAVTRMQAWETHKVEGAKLAFLGKGLVGVLAEGPTRVIDASTSIAPFLTDPSG